MPVVVYKCTVCNREIDLVEKPRGLERINRCVITNDCRGTLYQVGRKQNYAVGRPPPDVIGVTNYIQRNVIYNHRQSITDSEWFVQHNLGANPSVQVLVNRSEEINGEIINYELEIEPEQITLHNNNSLTIKFNRAESGLAQCIARSATKTNTTTATTVVQEEKYIQASVSGILTIGIEVDSTEFPDGSTSPGSKLVRIYYLGREDLTPAAFETAVYGTYEAKSPPAATSSWSDVDRVFVNGKAYKVYTIDIGDPVDQVGAPSAATVTFQQGNEVQDFPYDQARDMVVLLSKPPFANIDKIKNRIFRPSWSETPNQTLESFIFANGEIAVADSIAEKVFPPIFILD